MDAWIGFTFAAFVIIVFEVGGAVLWGETTVIETKTFVNPWF